MIYFIQCGNSGPIKIGFTTDGGLRKRLRSLQIGNHELLRVLKTVCGDHAEERALHSRFASSRIRGEWFHPTDELLRHIEETSQCEIATTEPALVAPGTRREFAIAPDQRCPKTDVQTFVDTVVADILAGRERTEREAKELMRLRGFERFPFRSEYARSLAERCLQFRRNGFADLEPSCGK